MRRNVPPAFCLLGAFFIAGCASSDGPEHGGRERPHLVQPILKDSATFFDGAISADISLQPIVFQRPRGEEGADLGAPPRIELRGKFTNHTSAPIVIAVTDVTSALGNFAIRPEKLTLAAGESADIDPLPALYPDPIDELTVDVRIRYAGKAESHSLRLKPAPTPAAEKP